MNSVFQLTRQEQFIVALIMLALIIGSAVRIYKHTRENPSSLKPSISTSNSIPPS